MKADEAAARRERSISYLAAYSVPYIDHLPNIDVEEETLRRTATEVGVRAICLALVSMKGAGADNDFVLDGAHHYDVVNNFTPEERRFLFAGNPSENDKIQFSWRVEAAHALLWAVEIVDDLRFPSEPCDWNAFWELFHNAERDPFLSRLNLRPQSSILDQADLIYRLHWATRDASLTGREPPSRLSNSVVMERHHALNWLIAPEEEPYPWDEVPTDT